MKITVSNAYETAQFLNAYRVCAGELSHEKYQDILKALDIRIEDEDIPDHEDRVERKFVSLCMTFLQDFIRRGVVDYSKMGGRKELATAEIMVSTLFAKGPDIPAHEVRNIIYQYSTYVFNASDMIYIDLPRMLHTFGAHLRVNECVSAQDQMTHIMRGLNPALVGQEVSMSEDRIETLEKENRSLRTNLERLERENAQIAYERECLANTADKLQEQIKKLSKERKCRECGGTAYDAEGFCNMCGTERE